MEFFLLFKQACCSTLGWMSNQLLLAPEHGKVQQYFYAFLQGLMWLLDYPSANLDDASL